VTFGGKDEYGEFMTLSDSKRESSQPPLRGRQVLVVEDDSDTREILKFVLEQNGAEVVAVGAVEPALEAFERTPPDAVVADIGMPGYNGYALIAKIRELDRKKQRRTKCVAVTAYATATDRDTTLNAGFDAYLAKPFAPDELVSTVVRLAV
jgi:CheY-like chemotaxis protein